MGRIKTRLVKSIALKLVKEHGNEFTPEFENNKELVEKYTTVSSAKMRNLIAGYIARLVKQKTIAEKEPRRRMHEEDLSKFYE
jgi:small subunit ribosomal protein S17e